MRGPGRASRILGVTELVRRLRDTLEGQGTVWVAGEISNLRRPPSGHLYFTLKDDESQVSAVLFQREARLLVFRPADGMEVVVAARASVYPARGQLQLYVTTMEPRGRGGLQLAFEQLRDRLQAEGLFAAERKRRLPLFPGTIGIVTALRGAVIHDMRTVLRRRWPVARVLVRPVPVQGRDAAPEIAAAIRELGGWPGVDVLIVGRGGGSLEDLWAFNEESVARAIAACPVPVISAVGHEVDYTIADLVADARAPTPTAAAQMVAPDRLEVGLQVGRLEEALRRALVRRAESARERLRILARGLGDPRRPLQERALRVDELGERARQAIVRRVAWERRELVTLVDRLQRCGPAAQLARTRERAAAAGQRLTFAMGLRLRRGRDVLAETAGRLDLLSPLACLARGYAIVRGDAPGAPVIREASALRPGDGVTLVLGRGRAHARIEGTED